MVGLFRRGIVTQAHPLRHMFDAAAGRQVQGGDLHATFGGHSDRLGTEAMVNESCGVRSGESIGNLNAHVERTPDGAPTASHFCAQRPALVVLEHHKHTTLVLTRVEHGRHIRVRDRAHGERPLEQMRTRYAMGHELCGEQPHRHGASTPSISRAEQLPWPARLELLQQVVMADDRDRWPNSRSHRALNPPISPHGSVDGLRDNVRRRRTRHTVLHIVAPTY